MLPSISYGNDFTIDPSIFIDGPFLNDMIPNCKQDPPFSFFHFPSSTSMHYDINDSDLLYQSQQHFKGDNNIVPEIDHIIEFAEGDSKKNHENKMEKVPRERSSRDRHSKIYTAQGPRDRRMRLSVEVARKFFGLQDMLGYDKASKTVEWLIEKAKVEIKRLARSLPRTKNASSISGFEVSEMYEAIKKNPSTCLKKVKRVRKVHKTSLQPLTKESRDNARARARERTKVKILTRRLEEEEEEKVCSEQVINGELNHLPPWSSLETGEDTESHNINPSPEELSSYERDPFRASEGMIDDSWVIKSKWNPTFSFNYQHSNEVSKKTNCEIDHVG